MYSLRKTKTASGATAVQVVRYRDRKVVVMKHVGSARTDGEIQALMQTADAWMRDHTGQSTLFPEQNTRILSLAHSTFAGVQYSTAYRTLAAVAARCGFDALQDALAVDLAIMRVFEPCSKRRSLELLDRYFAIHYAERSVYRSLRTIAEHKEQAESLAVACAKREFSFDCSLVLYDVTTLYFESFREDEGEKALRKTGFSKDQKSQQPQIVLGLLVASNGFPLGYELFKGNTFEGHTMLQVLETFRTRHNVKQCTVVADAAMLSFENMEELRARDISYIVGARVANLSPKRILEISRILRRRNDATARFSTQHGELLCSFSDARYRKDKHDMEKQIARAKTLIAKGESGRKAKFVQTAGASSSLNEKLVAKAKSLLGIKGYVTNIPKTVMDDQAIIVHYRNLWRVEQTFRMAKHDLEARPIFHHTEEAIRAHLLICFLSLQIAKYMELKTGVSIQRIVDLLRLVGEARVRSASTGETFLIPTAIPAETKKLLRQLGVSH
jgi:transposase